MGGGNVGGNQILRDSVYVRTVLETVGRVESFKLPAGNKLEQSFERPETNAIDCIFFNSYEVLTCNLYYHKYLFCQNKYLLKNSFKYK